jgi:tetratricopeptide (TPR) repeat protein
LQCHAIFGPGSRKLARDRLSGRNFVARSGLLAWLVTFAPATGGAQTSPPIRSTSELRALLSEGRLAEAEAGAARAVAGAHPRNRADSIAVFAATEVLVEARLLLHRLEDPSMPELVGSLLSLAPSLYGPGALAVAHAHQYAGYVARGRSDRKGEVEHFQTALELIDRHDPPLPSELAIALGNLATTRFTAGADSAARTLLERAQQVMERSFPPDHIGLAPILLNLNDVRIAMGDTAGVAVAYARAVRIYEKQEGAEGPRVAEALHRLGVWHHQNGDPRTAARVLDRTVAILQQRDPRDGRLGSSLLARARVDLSLSEVDSAASRAARAGLILEAAYGTNAVEHAASLVTLGDAMRRKQRHDEAAESYVRALRILEGRRGSLRELADCLQALASLSLEMGRNSEAEEFARRTLVARTRLFGPRHRARRPPPRSPTPRRCDPCSGPTPPSPCAPARWPC